MFSPKFKITNQLLKNIGNIEAAKSVIDNAVLVPAWEVQFQKDATARTVHCGTHLEGNDLSLTQVRKIVEYADKRKAPSTVAIQAGVVGRERDVQEVINYRNVLKYITSLHDLHERSEKRFLYYKQSELKEIHRLTVEKVLPREGAGEYRDSRVVVRDSFTGEVSFRPPPPVEVPYQIEHFFEWLNSLTGREVHPVLRAGTAHYELVRIHPFTDGNGRVSRAFATLILFREGYDIRRFFSLEEYYDTDPLGYYQSLQRVSEENGDLSVWLEYFTVGLAIELNKIKDRVKSLSFDTLLKDKVGRQVALNERQIKIVEYLRENARVLMRDAKVLLPRVSEDTLLRDIKDLIKKKVVEKHGRTKAAYYMLREF